MRTNFAGTITFGTSGFSLPIEDITLPSITCEDIPTTHQGTTGGYETYAPGPLKEGNVLTFEVQFAPGTVPTVGGTAETITITMDGTTWVFSGYCNEFTPGGGFKEKMMATVGVKVAGAIAIS